ncbi:MarC family protein [Tautonia rosea]|uniref:MarC family protein n=1 Tax=Tautonia rosea TaxID=2728037 RepID=UPI0014764EE0|nr:MarC family protein [Tautonia rosea]
MIDFARSTILLLLLLNPFLVIVYLTEIVHKLNKQVFCRVLIRAGLIAGIVFCGFAMMGDAIFGDLLQVEFASFQIFGGIVILLIGLQFVFRGPTAIELLRGEPEHLAGAVAMPVLIGPGTISASVVIGKRLDPLPACAAIWIAVVTCLSTMALLKVLHDYVRPHRESLIRRYIEIAGRITALYLGTVAVEMIMKGARTWTANF